MRARYADGTPYPREAAKARDTTPTHLTKNPPPLSSGSALHWPRPFPILRHLLAAGHAPPLYPRPHWLLFHVTLSSSFLLA